MGGEVRDLTFERLLSFKLKVPMDVVLVDLWFLDGRMEGWARAERRFALAGSLIRRNFMTDIISALEFSDLWMRVKELFDLRSIDDVLRFCRRFYDYAIERRGFPPGRGSADGDNR
ncbi:hypothetical protein DRP77_06130 [Candidatus Poribacteria bacterium]|nr:MAG: hypothetical protein DRP77_06130 [Candidatus Poribacteria bacterium]